MDRLVLGALHVPVDPHLVHEVPVAAVVALLDNHIVARAEAEQADALDSVALLGDLYLASLDHFTSTGFVNTP